MHITDDGMENLAYGIGELISLEELNISIKLNITGQGISYLGEGIGKLENLKYLQLRFEL